MFSCRQGICIFVRGAIVHFNTFSAANIIQVAVHR
jgi:hypothetical protein